MSNRWTLQALKSLVQQLGAASLVFLAVTATIPAQAQQATVHSYAIPSQPLGIALNQLALSSDKQILAPPELVRGYTAPALSGRYTLAEALRKLLAGSGLTYEMRGATTIVITQHSPSSPQKGAQAPKSTNEPKAAPTQLAPVVVTGSRLPAVASQGPEEVYVYTGADIARSGQPTVADFLNTLPTVSTVVTEAGYDTNTGQETVRLRGLPIGSTLVLLDGRVVEGSGSNQSHGNPFDLNTIPIAAVERIEVLPEAASAVYGSDAIGGVVNIILRKDLNGGQASVTTGRPTEGGYRETTASIVWGKNFNRGNVTFIGSYQTRGELSNTERAITANADYRRFGAPDYRSTACFPGNVYSANGGNLPGLSSSLAGIPYSTASHLTPVDFVSTSGTLNKCTPFAALIPASHRGSILVNGHYDFTDTTQAFFNIIYSQVYQNPVFAPHGYTRIPVPANNPFNPFGIPVLVDYRFNVVGPSQNSVGTQYWSRILGGFKGRWAGRWEWEVAAWQSYDHTHFDESEFDFGTLLNALNNTNPAQSINLFTAGTPASQAVLNQIDFDNPGYNYSKLQTAQAFVRGDLIDLPAGPLDVVLGVEYNREKQSLFAPAEGSSAPEAYSRNTRSIFAEARVPLWAAPKHSTIIDRLALTLAGRYDRYSDFGGKFTPEAGLEFRPTDTLLLRASYGKAFKAPDLRAVDGSLLTYGPYALAPDPLRGGEIANAVIEVGGNPNIRPQTGTSRTIGLVWSSKAIPNLTVSLTNFRVTQNDRIIQPSPLLVVQDPSTFPSGLITRAAQTPEDIAKGYAGKIILVDARYINFGELMVEGNDLDVNYRFDTSAGTFSPSLAVTNLYKYVSATPGTPLQDRLGYASSDAFGTRWKGTVAINWAKGPWSARLDGRFLSGYEDYDLARRLGNYWLLDASAHYNFGSLFGTNDRLLKNAYADLAVVNALDRKPQFSNYLGLGYDPREWNIRGRFVSFTLGTRW